MTRWCECPEPDNDRSPFGECRTCKRKPHTECRICDNSKEQDIA